VLVQQATKKVRVRQISVMFGKCEHIDTTTQIVMPQEVARECAEHGMGWRQFY